MQLIGRSRLVDGDDQVVRELELAQAAERTGGLERCVTDRSAELMEDPAAHEPSLCLGIERIEELRTHVGVQESMSALVRPGSSAPWSPGPMPARSAR